MQENARTIQGELERVIGTLEDAPVKVAGSGRTDAGVHAEGQVANVKLESARLHPKNSAMRSTATSGATFAL